MSSRRNFLLWVVIASSFATLSPFLADLDAYFHGASVNLSGFYYLTPAVLAVLLISPIVGHHTGFASRVGLGLWLALFLWSGFNQIFVYDYPISSWPWTGYFVCALMLGIPLLVMTSKRVASLGLIRLTVCAGFVLVLAYDVLNLAYGYKWFGMYVRLGTRMWDTPEAPDWTQYLLVWLQYSDWLVFRLITYLGIGYILARRKGLLISMVISVLVAFLDSTLGLLVFLPGDGEFEAAPLYIVLQYDLPELLISLLAQVADLSILALLGALVAQVRWPRAILHPPRFIPATNRRYRPVHQIRRSASIAEN